MSEHDQEEYAGPEGRGIKTDVFALREEWRERPDYLCFLTSPDNPHGLRLTPEVQVGLVAATMRIEAHHSGYPGLGHGGISFTILDGLMGWYIFSHYGRGALTVESRVKYRKPLFVGQSYRFEVREDPKAPARPGRVAMIGKVFEVGPEGQVGKVSHLSVEGQFALASKTVARQIFGERLFALGKDFFGDE